MALHSVGLNPASLVRFDDGDPRIRLGTWFYSTGGKNTGWTCDGANIYLPAGVPSGITLRAYAIRWHDAVNLPAPDTIELGLPDRQGDIVTDGVVGWHQVPWAPLPFVDWPVELLFIYYEFVGAGAGDYLFSNTGNTPGSSIQSGTLPGLFCAGPSDVNSSARSWFAQGPSEMTSTQPASNGYSIWYGSDVLVNDHDTPVGSATLDHSWNISAIGETPTLSIPEGSANVAYAYNATAFGAAPDLDIPEGAAILSTSWSVTARGQTPADAEPLVSTPIFMQVSAYARDHIRQRATDLMNCTVRMTRPGTEYDPVTRRQISTEGLLIYEGPARVWEVPSGNQVMIGEEEIVVTSTYLTIPYWVQPLPESDDLVVVLASDDPDLTGRSLSIESVVRGGGLRASRRFQVTISESKKSTW